MSTSSDPERERRIENEIVVDCYDEIERSTGWHCYLDDRLAFPFEAVCNQELTVSPLRNQETVTVTGLADQDYCSAMIMVQIQWQDRSLAVPLSQLEVDEEKVDESTSEAISDWHYWVEQGYCF